MLKLRRFWGAASSWLREWARYDTWNVGVIALERDLRDIDDLRRLPTPRWLPEQAPWFYVADPFPYRDRGRDWILVEHYGHPKGVRGRIARIDPEAPRPVLETMIERPTHLSYPFTFECEGSVYCAPENGADWGCVLYRLGPDGAWTPADHILPGYRLVDPTFFRHQDRWWLFATETTGGGSVVLIAFHADAIEGPWTPHRRNPLKSDRATARPAGRPFTLAGQLYRPSQDCSRTYGGAINIMRVVELAPDRFDETVAARLEPDPAWPYPDGMHHLVIDGRRVYVDAKRQRYDCLRFLKVWLKRERPQ